MKYHPDVNTTGETHDPNAERFREIAEAYAVLSIPENKMSYDLTYNKNQDAIFSSVKSETMEKNRKMRDKTGHVPGPQPLRGSYAEFRMKALEKEREKFNVNHLGYYNGGLNSVPWKIPPHPPPAGRAGLFDKFFFWPAPLFHTYNINYFVLKNI